tara:strand:+ start:472 stop:714 length:243 start_codon:yes stop_codon:yes gene_type:complete
MAAHKKIEIDLRLSVACNLTPYGTTWSREELARLCGCSSEYIRELERKGLNKLRRRSALKQYAVDYLNVTPTGGVLIGRL